MLKRWLLLIMVLLVAGALISVSVLIPATLTVVSSGQIKAGATSVNRSLHQPADWRKWWPGGKTNRASPILSLDGHSFRIDAFLYNAVNILIDSGGTDPVNSRLSLIPHGNDSLLIYWSYQTAAGFNPLKKWLRYRRAVRLRHAMDTIVGAMKPFLSNPRNIYGVEIAAEMSNDSMLLMTDFKSPEPPSPKEIFDAVNRLQQYAAKSGAKQTNPPWKMTQKLPDSSFHCMVAIPVNIALNDKGNIVLRHYVPWKEITCDVTGGDSVIGRSFRQFRLFLADYQFRQMASPYEIMVTNRWLEKDSSKWVTRFSCPVP